MARPCGRRVSNHPTRVAPLNVVLQMVAQERGYGPVSATFRVMSDLDPRGFMGDPHVPPISSKCGYRPR